MDNYSFDGDNSAAASQAAAPAAPKKQGGKIIIASFVALLVGGAIASAIFLTINNMNGQKGDKVAANCDRNSLDTIAIQPAKDDNGNEIANKGTILDARLTAELAYKTNRILANTPTSERNVRMDTTGKMSDYTNLSDDMKMQLVMQQVDVRTATKKEVGEFPENSDIRKRYAEIYKNTDTEYSVIEVGVIYVDDAIKSDYKYLFNGEPKTYPDIYDSFNIQTCNLEWDNVQKIYYTATQCGGGTSIGHSLFQYKYLLDGEKAYVYVAIGASKDAGDDNEVLYSGFIGDGNQINAAKAIKEGISDAWYQGVGGDFYNPTSSDYEPIYKYVQHYRAVFEKGSDGDFYYKTLEKVND
jgi:hypothetical protein